MDPTRDNTLTRFTPASGHDPFGVGASWAAHIALYWGASNNILSNNAFRAVDPDDDDLSNVHLAGPLEEFGLPGAADNLIRAGKQTKVWDETSDYNPYDPDTYNGDNDIQLEPGH